MSLVQKLARIRAISDVVQKNKRGYNYTYTDLAEILAKVKVGMSRYRVSLIPQIVPGTGSVQKNVAVNTKFDKTGKQYDQTVTEMMFSADMVFRWVNDDDPNDFIDVPWFVSGSQSDPSQAIGSGLSYTTRQFLTNYFQIATTEYDVDGFRSKQKAAEVAEDAAIAEKIIGEFDLKVRSYIASHPDKAEEVKTFVAKYVRGANYNAIKEPALASKLTQDFSNTFLGGQ